MIGGHTVDNGMGQHRKESVSDDRRTCRSSPPWTTARRAAPRRSRPSASSRARSRREICPRFTRDGPRLHEIDPRRAARAQRRESTRDCARLPETGHRASNALQPLSRAHALKASKQRNETKAVLRRWHSPLSEVAPVGPSALLVHKRQLEAPAGPRCEASPINNDTDYLVDDGRRWRVRG